MKHSNVFILHKNNFIHIYIMIKDVIIKDYKNNINILKPVINVKIQ